MGVGGGNEGGGVPPSVILLKEVTLVLQWVGVVED